MSNAQRFSLVLMLLFGFSIAFSIYEDRYITSEAIEEIDYNLYKGDTSECTALLKFTSTIFDYTRMGFDMESIMSGREGSSKHEALVQRLVAHIDANRNTLDSDTVYELTKAECKRNNLN